MERAKYLIKIEVANLVRARASLKVIGFEVDPKLREGEQVVIDGVVTDIGTLPAGADVPAAKIPGVRAVVPDFPHQLLTPPVDWVIEVETARLEQVKTGLARIGFVINTDREPASTPNNTSLFLYGSAAADVQDKIRDVPGVILLMHDAKLR